MGDLLPGNRVKSEEIFFGMLKYVGREYWLMKRSNFTSEQIVFVLRQTELGTPVAEVCRKMGIVEQTFYRWKRKYI